MQTKDEGEGYDKMVVAYCEERENKELKTTLARQLSRRHMLKEGFNTNLEVKKDATVTKKGGKTQLAGWKHFVAGDLNRLTFVKCGFRLIFCGTKGVLPGLVK